MRAQLRLLDVLSRQPHITIRILPMDVIHCGLDCGARFTMLTFPTQRNGVGEPPLVFCDNLTGAAYLDKPAEIKAYDAVWNGVLRAALTPAESRKLITTHAER